MCDRRVTVVLCTEQTVLGALPEFDVEEPWWSSVGPVVEGVDRLFDLRIVVLRMLTVDTSTPADGGKISYLAQVDRNPTRPLQQWIGPDPLVERPGRAPYARPGGPQADLRWAQEALDRRGHTVDGAPRQIKTWNLASIWQLSTKGGAVWLKSAPPMFGAEAALVAALQDQPVPRVVANRPGRLLTEDIPGEDQYLAEADLRAEMVDVLHDIQRRYAGDSDGLLAIGVRDQRLAGTVDEVEAVVERHASELPSPVRDRLERLVAALPRLAAEIACCGLPDTLVHGDFHPGNVRGSAGRLVILDWADAVVGNPALDWLRFSGWNPRTCPESIRRRWVESWRTEVPGCDPERAAALIRPFAALLGAVGYQRFLDHIEPDEHPYHAADPLACLLAAAC